MTSVGSSHSPGTPTWIPLWERGYVAIDWLLSSVLGIVEDEVKQINNNFKGHKILKCSLRGVKGNRILFFIAISISCL